MRGFARPSPLGDLDHPQCACGAAMRLSTVEPQIKSPRTSIHTFICTWCGLQLKVLHDESELPGTVPPARSERGGNIGSGVDRLPAR